MKGTNLGELQEVALLTIPSALGASKGRGGFTKNAADEYKFKTPQLYNLKDHNFFVMEGHLNLSKTSYATKIKRR